MTPFALGFMITSITCVTALVAYCYWRILTARRPLDAEAEDRTD